jgi:hypothetical protein
VMDVLRMTGRTAGLYRFDDVLVESQLARPGPGLRRPAANPGVRLDIRG